MKQVKDDLSPSGIETIYFGGGTPSLLKPNQLHKIIETIKAHKELREDCEVAMELDPGTFDTDKLNALHDLGVNRFSMGVQTFNEQEFNLLGRGHDFKDVMKSIEYLLCSRIKPESVSIDLIMGVPEQTIKSFQ